MTTAVVVLSASAAKTLTERIRKAGEDFGRLLLDAHEGEAWRVMGYATWQDYIAAEFTFTRDASYKLLTQARVERAVGEPVSGKEAARVYRAIHASGETLPSEPSPAVQRLLAEQREVQPIPKPSARGHAVRGLPGLIISVRALDETLGRIADERSAEDDLPPDLTRVLQRLATTIEGLVAASPLMGRP